MHADEARSGEQCERRDAQKVLLDAHALYSVMNRHYTILSHTKQREHIQPTVKSQHPDAISFVPSCLVG